MTNVALADEAKPDEAPQPPPDGTTNPPPAKADAAVAAGMFTAATWPKEYVARPQSAAKGMIEVTPKFEFLRSTSTDTMGNSTSTNITDLGVGARYGISDKIEALAAFNRIILSGVDGIETGDRVKGQLALGAGIVVAKGKLDVEVKAAIVDELGGLGIKALALQAGADVRYHINEKMWIGTPINRPGLIAGLTNVKFADMEIPDSKALQFTIPAAFAYQATPELAIQANTELLTFNLNDASKAGAGDKSVTFFSQDEFGGIPLDFDIIYALSNKMDVIGNVNLVDLKNVGDNLGITVGVNVRM